MISTPRWARPRRRGRRRFAIGLLQASPPGPWVFRLVFGTGWMILVDEPFGGEPMASPLTSSRRRSRRGPADEPNLRVIRLSPRSCNRSEATRIEAAPVVSAAQQDHHDHRRNQWPCAGRCKFRPPPTKPAASDKRDRRDYPESNLPDSAAPDRAGGSKPSAVHRPPREEQPPASPTHRSRIRSSDSRHGAGGRFRRQIAP